MALSAKELLADELKKAAELLQDDYEHPVLGLELVVMSKTIANEPALNPFPKLRGLTDGLKSAGFLEQAENINAAIEDYKEKEGGTWLPPPL